MRFKRTFFPFWVIVLLLCICPKFVYAGSAIEAKPGGTISCGTYPCYDTVGIRLTLYTKSGNTFVSKGSYDVTLKNKTVNSYANKFESKGKVTYQMNSLMSITIDSSFSKITQDTYSIPCYWGAATCNSNKFKNKLKEVLKDKTKLNYYLRKITGDDTVVYTDFDANNSYITVEPTAVWIISSTTEYYGTAYQIANYKIGGNYIAGNGWLFYSDSRANYDQVIFAGPIDGSNPGDFVGTKDVCEDCLVHSNASYGGLTWSNRKTDKTYGIGVYWMKELIPADCIRTCSVVDGVACGENKECRLKCAENYCKSKTTVDDKKSCITSCGYTPSTMSCPSYSAPSATTTECEDIETSEKNTCTDKSGTEYYQKKCIDSTTVKYSNSLPVWSRGGFNYSLSLSGKSTCTYTLNVKQVQLEYASCIDDDCRNGVVNKINQYNDKFNSGSNYDISSSSAKLIIKGQEYPLSLFNGSNSVNFVDSKDEESITLQLYNSSGTSKTMNTYKKKIKVSEGSGEYILEPKCYSLKTGLVTNKSGSICKLDDEIKNVAYYGYYIGDNETGRVDTETIVKKDSSGLNDTNTCYYEVGDPSDFTCRVIYDTEDSQYELKALSIKAGAGSSSVLKYYYSDNPFDGQKNNVNLKNLTEDYTVLDGYNSSKYVYVVKTSRSTGEIEEIKACPQQRTSKCNDKCTSSDYECANRYCSTNYYLDGFDSPKDCYQVCTDAACPYDCDITSAMETFCKNKAKRESAGYKDYPTCVKACSCNNTNKEYIYRPISLSEPFPNDRDPGSNWLGWDMGDEDTSNDLIQENDMSGTPMYVVEIDADDLSGLNDIRGMTTSSDYLKYEGEYKDSQYVSKYLDILADNGILTCRRGTGGGCSE